MNPQQYSQQIQLFDRKFVTNTLRNHYRCPKCQNEFMHNFQMVYGETHVKSNRPFLLPCGHNMCENCIFQNRSNLTCNVCIRPVPVGNASYHSQFYVREYFDMNFYLLGAINFFSYSRRNTSNNNSVHTSVIGTSATAPANFGLVQKCSECENSAAIGLCRQCKFHYCGLCFKSVHKNSKVLKRHKLEDEENKSPRFLHMPKPRMCYRHHRTCERFCKTCRVVCCGLCIKIDHPHHGWSSISDENNKVKDDVYQLLETIKDSRENLRKAQKDVKSTEKQLNEYATQTLHDISKYFLELHSFLQLEESRIVKEFNELSQQPQEKLREAYFRLGDTQNTLNSMHSSLEFHLRKLPSDILMHEVVAATNIQLEQLPCQVQISKGKMIQNPFSFQVQRDIRTDFSKYIGYEYADPQLSIRIGPIYGDLNRSIQEAPSSLDASLDTAQHKKRNNKRNQKKKWEESSSFKNNFFTAPSTHNICAQDYFPQLPSTHNNMYAMEAMNAPKQESNEIVRFARISHVNSPEHFYIQQEGSLHQIKELSNKCVNYTFTESVPMTISEGNYYMAYRTEDTMWYRAMVKKILPMDLYRMFLIDIGMFLEVPRQRICGIDKSALAIPHSAIRCAIHDIMPAGAKDWPEEANQLLIEITNNKTVHVNIIERIKNSIWKVDIITEQSSEAISMRDSFLYTGLAQERPGALNFKLQPKKMSPVARINQRLQKQIYHQGEMLIVQVTHIEDPQEFFVVKLDQRDAMEEMRSELNQPCENLDRNQIYLASLQMCCALKLKGSWHRACVEEIKERGKIRVRLVDEGPQETVNWNQLFVLPEKYRQHKEFAIKCAVADIEPLQENNYTWTDEAIKEFKQLCGNPTLQLLVYSAKAGEYKVALHICKKLTDINIGAKMVKHGHGLSTGESTQALDKTPRKLLQNPAFQEVGLKEKRAHDNTAAVNNAMNMSVSLPSTEKTDIRILKRTLVNVRHIETPGEFYVALKKVDAGIRNFHRQIQECEAHRQQLKENSSESQIDYKDWFLGDHCLVYTSYNTCGIEKPPPKENNQYCEYYRGIIVAIELEPDPLSPFVVFLRDVGATVSSIRKTQLHAIDSQLDRVTNAVQRCHMACVQPTGGVQSWSKTAIESFKSNVQQFRNLGVTLQGERQFNSNSIPVVLWGMTTETADPLAPCISKYANINRMLVNAGLAHLVERLDMTKQMDRIMQHELQEGEITIEEWFKKFSARNKALNLIENIQQPMLKEPHNATDDECMTSRIDLLSDTEEPDPNSSLPIVSKAAIKSWLQPKSINKSIFTAYPTYVDYDAIIYMHDAADDVLLKKLRSKIQKMYAQKTDPNQLDNKYAVGTPCLAKYHIDKHLYRALVKRVISEDEFDVLFIDYGNVERCEKSDLRLCMPFPKLPMIACKYRIEGICPTNGESSYPTKVLDIMHAMLVGQLVSVRVPTSELQNEIKGCSIRVGSDDVADLLIADGLVEAHAGLPTEVNAKNGPANQHEVKPIRRSKKQSNSLPLEDLDKENSSTKPSRLGPRVRNLLYSDIEKKLDGRRLGSEDFDMYECEIYDSEYKDADIVIESADEDEDEIDELLDERFNLYLSQMEKEEGDIDTDAINTLVNTVVHNSPQYKSRVLKMSPSKKRMFDLDDYRKMHDMQQKMVYNPTEDGENLDSNVFECDDAADVAADGLLDFKDDEDVVDLECSFAWQTASSGQVNNIRKPCRKIMRELDKDSVISNDLESVSDFDKFQPYETSSVFSHISGIKFFKSPQLPPGMRSFFCKVVTILTPVILHIFPHLAELEYRETELERRIQHMAKRAPLLVNIEPNSVCLACYSKDKKWYRAFIRSYNPSTKTTDVLYVDYLNTETVPLKNLRQYPMELSSWPLRTFCVKLAGLQPNPRMREKDIRRALYNILAGRILHARLENQPEKRYKADEEDEDDNGEPGKGLQEIRLYESKTAVSSMVVYEELILENFYFRI